MDHVHDKRWQLPLWFLLFSSSFPKSACPTQALRRLWCFCGFLKFFQLENSGSHLAMSTDDWFLPQGKQILTKIVVCWWWIQYNFFWSIYMKIDREFSSQRREMHRGRRDVTCKPAMINWEKRVDAARTLLRALRRWKLVSINFDQIQVKQIVLKDSGG